MAIDMGKMDFEEVKEGELDWDGEVTDNGFTLLEDGDYRFTVAKLERERYEGGEKIGPCPRAKVTLSVDVPNGKATVTDSMLLHTKVQWRIIRFFEGLGFEPGEDGKMRMHWNEVEGKTGICRIVQKPNYNDASKSHNEVERYYKPEEFGGLTLGPDAPGGEQQSWSM